MVGDSRAEHIVQGASLQEVCRNHPHLSSILKMLLQPQASQVGDWVYTSFLVFQKRIKTLVSHSLLLQESTDFSLFLLNKSNNCFAKIFRDILCVVFNFPDHLFLFFLRRKPAVFAAGTDFMKFVGRILLNFAYLLRWLTHSFLEVGVYLNLPN